MIHLMRFLQSLVVLLIIVHHHFFLLKMQPKFQEIRIILPPPLALQLLEETAPAVFLLRQVMFLLFTAAILQYFHQASTVVLPRVVVVIQFLPQLVMFLLVIMTFPQFLVITHLEMVKFILLSQKEILDDLNHQYEHHLQEKLFFVFLHLACPYLLKVLT